MALFIDKQRDIKNVTAPLRHQQPIHLFVSTMYLSILT